METLADWQQLDLEDRQARLRTLVHGLWPPAQDYVDLVRAPEHWGLFASTGPNFRAAIFGRDSLETAEDLLTTHRSVVRDVILCACHLQGQKFDVTSEEEPGKIHHEFRSVRFGNHEVPKKSLKILRDLQEVWGGRDTDRMTYYGSFDATPLLIRLVGWYVERYGTDILDTTVERRNGSACTVRDCVLSATQWLAGKIAAQPAGLFAYRRTNPLGLVNQVWKDSPTAYVKLDGELPDHNNSIASAELQGYAYDALLAAIDMKLGNTGMRKIWRDMATELQRQTIQLLWMESEQFFAQGITFDSTGNSELIATITSTGAALLDSRLIHDLPADKAAPYIHGIVRHIFSPELLTSCGIRCRATRHRNLLNFIDYHGCNTVWPKETYDIAKGLRRSGLPHLAQSLEDRIRSSIAHASDFYEFFYVDYDGTVWYDRDRAIEHFGAMSPGHMLPVPETGQAWTISAVERIIAERATTNNIPVPTAFEKKALQQAAV